MKVLLSISEITKEAKMVAENYFDSLKILAEKNAIPAETQEDFFASLVEHLSIAIREELDKLKVTEIDAQIMMELLCSLGSKEELIESLSDNIYEKELVETAQSAEKDTSDSPKAENSQKESWKHKFRRPPFRRSRKNAWLMGVCGGIGEYWGISPLLVRLLFMFSGIGLVAYFIIGFLIPVEEMNGDNQNSSSMAIRVLETGVKAAIIVFAILPLCFALGVISLAGFSKLMYEFGITGMPSGDLWAYYVIGLPGLLSGIANFLIGACFITVLVNFSTGLLFKRTILSLNTKRLLILVAIFSISMQGVLFGVYKIGTKTKSYTTGMLTYKADSINKLAIEFSKENAIWANKIVQVFSDSSLKDIKVETVKRARGFNTERSSENADKIKVSQKVTPNGELKIECELLDYGWWFYPSQELELNVYIPENHKLECNFTDESNRSGEVLFANINQPLNLKIDRGNLTLRDISSPLVNVDIHDGYIDASRMKVKDCNFKLDVGRFTGRSLIFDSAEIYSNVGYVELRDIQGKNLNARTRVGHVELSNSKVDTLKLESDVGKVSLDETTFSNSNIDTQVGGIRITNCTGNKLTGKTQTGSVKFSAEKVLPNFDCTLSSQVGSVKISLPANCNPEIRASTQMGKIKNEFSSVAKDENSPIFKLKTQMGKIGVYADQPDQPSQSDNPNQPDQDKAIPPTLPQAEESK